MKNLYIMFGAALTAFAAIAAASLLSCSLAGDYRAVSLYFPPIPAQWQTLYDGLSWEIDVPGVLDAREKILLADKEGQVTLRLPKSGPVPILAYPVLREGELGKPAGAVHPFQTDGGGRLQLSWVDGYGALITGILIANGNPHIGTFNIPRLLQTLKDVSCGNPWNVDTRVLLSAMTWGGFRSDRVRVLPLYSLEVSPAMAGLDDGGPGKWVSVNPLEPPPSHNRLGGLLFTDIPEGVNRYIFTGTGDRLLIQTDQDGYLAVILDGEKTESGTW